jgi:asparagine synthetase B (glutamine-hydrolysing)
MCSIIGSFDVERLRELAALNAYRGTHSHSLFVFDKDYKIMYAYRGLFELNIDKHLYAIREGDYIVAHQQAPTTDAKDMLSVHPAEHNGMYLWHNGIIKDNVVKELQKLYDTDTKWDTKLILQQYATTGNFDNLDGTFACVLYDNKQLYLARNEISPLFYDELGDISSTKFHGSRSVPANKILTFDINNVNIDNVVNEFTTVENPYYFG